MPEIPATQEIGGLPPEWHKCQTLSEKNIKKSKKFWQHGSSGRALA
jgi:hypothetical protein